MHVEVYIYNNNYCKIYYCKIYVARAVKRPSLRNFPFFERVSFIAKVIFLIKNILGKLPRRILKKGNA